MGNLGVPRATAGLVSLQLYRREGGRKGRGRGKEDGERGKEGRRLETEGSLRGK